MEETKGSSTSKIVGNDILTRGRSWLDERVPYSQSATHTNDFGTYRTDCSGYVSMAWALDQSRNTWGLWDVTTKIAASDLQPGDALLIDNDQEDHVALFIRWAAEGQPVVWEEFETGHVAEEHTWESLRGFTPVHYNGSTGGATSGTGAGASAPSGLPVEVTWNGVANSEASLNVQLTDNRTIGPCIAVDILRDEYRRKISDGLGYRFTGKCISPNITPVPSEIVGFEVCTAENNNWSAAKCTSAPWDQKSKTVHIDN